MLDKTGAAVSGPGAALICDGCQLPASDEHITRRLLRLEMASRFRPLRITTLFLAEAPPPRLEDYFYWTGEDLNVRGGLSRILFDELMSGLGIAPQSGAAAADEACLAEFQKRGFFLADCLECPVEEIVPGVRERTARANPTELAHRYGASIAERVKNSYQPSRVVLVSTRTRHLIPIFEHAGLGQRLLLFHNLPLHFPHPHNPAAQAAFREGLTEVMARAGRE